MPERRRGCSVSMPPIPRQLKAPCRDIPLHDGKQVEAEAGDAVAAPPAPPAWGSLHVVTTGMTGGYLLTSRSNYSARAVLREQFVYHSDFGADYMTVVAIIEDGGSTGVTSSTFKKEADGSRFSPTACEVFR